MTHQPRASFQSPRFAQPATFMRLPHIEDPRGLDVAIVGVPYDGGTSYRPGARLGPREIRAQSSLIRTYSYFQKVAPFDRLNVADVGDVDAPPVSIEKCYEAVEARIGAIADAGARPIVIGGDHSISLPILRALARRHGPLALVQFDAHIDTWDEYFGGKYFHGTPFRRAIEEGIIDGKRFIQVGIRGPMYGEEDFEFHREHGITMLDIDQVKTRGMAWVIDEIRRVATGPGVHDVRHRFGGSRVRAGHGDARGRRPDQPRGAAAGAGAGGSFARRRRHRRGGASFRRPGPDHRAPRGEPDVRVPVRAGAGADVRGSTSDRGAPLQTRRQTLADPATAEL